mmetsp:Transcript_64190/g.181027  ORF Transcript_64190/g.181027 Transcript_64190/m.181027 type:complete len:315 (+) Transcript_64190:743-1687(+)
MVGRPALPSASRDELCRSQDVIDATVNVNIEQTRQDVHRFGAATTVVVPGHEEHISGLPVGANALCPRVAQRSGAILAEKVRVRALVPLWPVGVHEEHVGARGLVLEADPVHPALSPTVLRNLLGVRLAELGKDLGVPSQRGGVRRGPLKKVEAAEPGAAEGQGHILALLEADEVEGALTLDPAMQLIPAIVLLHVPPIQVERDDRHLGAPIRVRSSALGQALGHPRRRLLWLQSRALPWSASNLDHHHSCCGSADSRTSRPVTSSRPVACHKRLDPGTGRQREQAEQGPHRVQDSRSNEARFGEAANRLGNSS